jgi:hypothetical protein
MCIGIPLVNVIIINFIDPTRMFSYIAFLLAIIFCIFIYKKLKSFFPHKCKISCSKAIKEKQQQQNANRTWS